MSSTLLVTQDHFANCSLLVFSLPQVCSRSPSPTCAPLARATTSCPTSPVVLQELPALPNFTSCPASFHVLRYLICCPTRAPTSYTTSPVVLQVFPHPTLPHQLSCKSSHILRYLISCPARVPTSYATSSALLQEFPHPSYATSPVIPQVFPHPTLPHQLSCKCSHILHYPPAVLQELPVCVIRGTLRL